MTRALSRRLRPDDGMMTHSMLLTMMITAVIGMIVSAILVNIQVQRANELMAIGKDTADQLGALVLSDLNDGYPIEYLNMSEDDLREATTFRNPVNESHAYVSAFDADSTGWTYAQITTFSNPLSQGREYTYKYRASSNIGYIGKDADSMRPVWAPKDAGAPDVPTLALFEFIADSGDKSDYPPAPWEAGQRPNDIQNPRVIRSKDYGVVLAWNRPSNSGPSALDGYEVSSANTVPDASCLFLGASSGSIDGVDAFLILNDDIHAAPNAWRCNSIPSSKVSIRATSPNGLGDRVIVTLEDLHLSSDLFPEPPSGLPTGLSVDTLNSTSSTAFWSGTTCGAEALIQYQFVWTSGTSGASPWMINTEYAINHPPGTQLSWRVFARCVGAYNNSPITQSNEHTFFSMIDEATNLRVIESTITKTTFAWDSIICGPGSVPQYRVNTYNYTSGAFIKSSAEGWAPQQQGHVTNTAGVTQNWTVEARCMMGSVPSATSETPRQVFASPPNPVTGLASSGSLRLDWNAATCGPGATAEYIFHWIPRTPASEIIQTATWITIPMPSDGTLGKSWSVMSRCAIDIFRSGYSTANPYNYPTVPPAPQINVSGLSFNNTTKQASWSAGQCSYGTPQYRFVWTAGATGASGWASALNHTPSTTLAQGKNFSWRVEIRCIAEGIFGPTLFANGPTVYYDVLQPGVPSSASRSGANWYGITWSAVSCGVGTTTQYNIRYTRTTPSQNQLRGWSTSRSWQLSAGQPIGSTMYYTIYTRCINTETGVFSPSNNRRAYWGGPANNASGYPVWG